jgi:hypothetical protein
MTIGAIGGCSDNASNVLRPDQTQRPGEEKLNPIEEASRLAEKNGEVDTSGLRDQRVNPSEDAAKVGTTQNLAQAAEVNRLRDGGSEATEGAGEAGEAGGRADGDEPAGQPQTDRTYQAADASDSRFPNRGGVLDFQI